MTRRPTYNPLPPIDQKNQLSSVSAPKTYSAQPQKPAGPACLYDGSGSSIPEEYMESGGDKITSTNLQQRLKEVEYTAQRLKKAGVNQLMTDATDYINDIM